MRRYQRIAEVIDVVDDAMTQNEMAEEVQSHDRRQVVGSSEQEFSGRGDPDPEDTADDNQRRDAKHNRDEHIECALVAQNTAHRHEILAAVSAEFQRGYAQGLSFKEERPVWKFKVQRDTQD